MSAEIRGIHNAAKSDVRAMLKEALTADLRACVILGVKTDGALYSSGSAHGRGSDNMSIVYLMEDFKWHLFNAANERELSADGA